METTAARKVYIYTNLLKHTKTGVKPRAFLLTVAVPDSRKRQRQQDNRDTNGNASRQQSPAAPSSASPVMSPAVDPTIKSLCE